MLSEPIKVIKSKYRYCLAAPLYVTNTDRKLWYYSSPETTSRTPFHKHGEEGNYMFLMQIHY